MVKTELSLTLKLQLNWWKNKIFLNEKGWTLKWKTKPIYLIPVKKSNEYPVGLFP